MKNLLIIDGKVQPKVVSKLVAKFSGLKYKEFKKLNEGTKITLYYTAKEQML